MRYFSSRVQAGQMLAQGIEPSGANKLSTVVSLSTDAASVAVQIAQKLKSPLQLYLTESVTLPGESIAVGGINQSGGFSFGSDIEGGYADYYYQEYRGYLEEAKREKFSEINRTLGSREVIRKDLLRGRSIFIVADFMDSTVKLDSFLTYLKVIAYERLVICCPLIMSNIRSHIEQISQNHYVLDQLDYFYGADHYFEDNTVIPGEEVITAVDHALRRWP